MIIEVNNSLQCSLVVDPVSFVVLPVMTAVKIKKEKLNIYHKVAEKTPKMCLKFKVYFATKTSKVRASNLMGCSEIPVELLKHEFSCK